MTEATARRLTWLLLALAMIIRLAVSGFFLLTPDEANYWQWSRYLDLGYHDHPPMIAWTIWLSTQLFGQSELAVRLPTLLGIATASAFISLLAARWYSWQVALYTTLASQSLLLLNGAALIATPDGLLLPCWAAAAYSAAVAVDTDRLRHWLLTGIWFGLGLLSKYTMLLFLPSLFFALLCVPPYRGRLLTWKPWFSLLCGFVLFTPVIIWNAQHNWVTFRHVLFQGGANNTALLTGEYIGEFLATQAGLLSPVLFVLILSSWVWGWQSNARTRFLLWLSLTGFVVFCLLALHVRIYGNWSAPVYLTVLIVLAARYSPARPAVVPWRNWVWHGGVIFSALVSAVIMLQLLYPVLPVSAEMDRTAQESSGWDEIAQAVDEYYRTIPTPEKTFIFGLRYQTASELAFYLPGQPRTVSVNRWTRPNVYDFWFEDQMLLGRDGLALLEQRSEVFQLKQVFSLVGRPIRVASHRTSPWFGKEVVRTMYMVKCWGFKGGLRWQPKNPRDIRVTID